MLRRLRADSRRLLQRLECLHANPWRHPLFVFPPLGNAAFSIGNVLKRDWYKVPGGAWQRLALRLACQCETQAPRIHVRKILVRPILSAMAAASTCLQRSPLMRCPQAGQCVDTKNRQARAQSPRLASTARKVPDSFATEFIAVCVCPPCIKGIFDGG